MVGIVKRIFFKITIPRVFTFILNFQSWEKQSCREYFPQKNKP